MTHKRIREVRAVLLFIVFILVVGFLGSMDAAAEKEMEIMWKEVKELQAEQAAIGGILEGMVTKLDGIEQTANRISDEVDLLWQGAEIDSETGTILVPAVGE